MFNGKWMTKSTTPIMSGYGFYALLLTRLMGHHVCLVIKNCDPAKFPDGGVSLRIFLLVKAM